MKLLVNVTDEIIKESASCPLLKYSSNVKEKRYIASNCMISLAVREIFPNALVYTSIELQGKIGEIYPFGDENDDNTIILSSFAVRMIDLFDESTSHERIAKIKPFKFEIDVPDVVIDKIGIDQVKFILSKSSTLDFA